MKEELQPPTRDYLAALANISEPSQLGLSTLELGKFVDKIIDDATTVAEFMELGELAQKVGGQNAAYMKGLVKGVMATMELIIENNRKLTEQLSSKESDPRAGNDAT